MVFDGRLPKPIKERYDWPHSFIIDFCNEAPKYFKQIKDGMKETDQGRDFETAEVEQALQDLIRKRLLYEESGRYLTLALPVNQTY